VSDVLILAEEPILPPPQRPAVRPAGQTVSPEATVGQVLARSAGALVIAGVTGLLVGGFFGYAQKRV